MDQSVKQSTVKQSLAFPIIGLQIEGLGNFKKGSAWQQSHRNIHSRWRTSLLGPLPPWLIKVMQCVCNGGGGGLFAWHGAESKNLEITFIIVQPPLHGISKSSFSHLLDSRGNQAVEQPIWISSRGRTHNASPFCVECHFRPPSSLRPKVLLFHFYWCSFFCTLTHLWIPQPFSLYRHSQRATSRYSKLNGYFLHRSDFASAAIWQSSPQNALLLRLWHVRIAVLCVCVCGRHSESVCWAFFIKKLCLAIN